MPDFSMTGLLFPLPLVVIAWNNLMRSKCVCPPESDFNLNCLETPEMPVEAR